MNKIIEAVIRHARLGAVERWLRPAKRWADLGCHPGYALLKAHPGLAERAWGLDLTIADGKDGTVELMRRDITKPLPFEDSSLDLVTALAVLEHIDTPRQVLAEVRRCLAPGGRLVVTTPSHWGIVIHDKMLKLGLVKDVEPDEHRDFGMNPALLAGWAREAGLEVEHCGSFEMGINVLLVARRPR